MNTSLATVEDAGVMLEDAGVMLDCFFANNPAWPQHASLARELAHRVRDFGIAVQDVLRDFRSRALAQQNGHKTEELAIMEVVLRSQYMQERLADAACDLYASSCTLSRMNHLLNVAGTQENELQAGRYFLALANRRIRQSLAALWNNDDAATSRTADLWLGRPQP